MVIVSTTLVFYRKNPDGRYQFMADDRASFMKSQSQLTGTTELDALAATARGDKAGYKHGLDLDDDNESISSASMRRRTDTSNLSIPTGAVNNSYGRNNNMNPPHSPVDPSVPLFPAPGAPQRAPSPYNAAPPPSRGHNNSNPPEYRAQNNAR